MGTYVWRITLELIRFFKNPQWHNEQIFKSFSQKETRSDPTDLSLLSAPNTKSMIKRNWKSPIDRSRSWPNKLNSLLSFSSSSYLKTSLTIPSCSSARSNFPNFFPNTIYMTVLKLSSSNTATRCAGPSGGRPATRPQPHVPA